MPPTVAQLEAEVVADSTTASEGMGTEPEYLLPFRDARRALVAALGGPLAVLAALLTLAGLVLIVTAAVLAAGLPGGLAASGLGALYLARELDAAT